MRCDFRSRVWQVCYSACLMAGLCYAQDLTPRAYVITPVHSNAITLTYSFETGSVLFDSALPIAGASGRIDVPIISYYHALNFLGRSANITAALGYSVGHFQADVKGTEQKLYRSGLTDSIYRFSVNLKGGPAMPIEQFMKWKQKTLIGASLKVVAPTGQYNPTDLVNIGSNRWGFKPELGFSQRRGHWLFDTYGGVWLFTTNTEFFSHNRLFPGTNTQHQSPIGSFEGHLSYNVTLRFWVSLDGNFWFGGRTSFNGVENPNTLQTNSRIGGTAAIPVSKHQTLKVSYSNGDYIRFGGNYQNVSLAWQYSWLGRPK
jgi:Putative MetA-pathway of phenol degradation